MWYKDGASSTCWFRPRMALFAVRVLGLEKVPVGLKMSSTTHNLRILRTNQQTQPSQTTACPGGQQGSAVPR